MGWLIQCSDQKCGHGTWAGNIVDLIAAHRDGSGWFVCGKCAKPTGYVQKSFPLQEQGETWEPYLRGIIPLGVPDDTYQPFVFLVSESPDSPANSLWLSYYKDLRKKDGGRLKLGYGPGGPPVLGTEDVLRLLRQLVDVGCITQQQIADALR